MVVAAGLDHEEQRVAVPDRLADLRVGRAVEVERGRQQPVRAAGRVDDCDLAVVRKVVAARAEVARDRGTVGRPRGRGVRGLALRQLLGLASVGVDDVDVTDEVDVPVLLAGGNERELVAVRRPGRVPVLEVAVRELGCGRGAVRRDGEEVAPAVAGPAFAVELELQPRKTARPAALVVFLVVVRIAHTRAEGKARAVGRPRRLRDVLVELGQPQRLAAPDRDHVELFDLAVAVGDEGEPLPVGRPARGGVRLGAGRELPRLRRAVQRNEPDGRGVVVLVAVETPCSERGPAPVGRDPRVVGPCEPVKVVRVHLSGVNQPD